MSKEKDLEVIQLEKFLIDENLTELENLITPNIFDILQITDMEIRHSNILAYLLNPNENHKMDDKFIKSFLQEIWFKNKQQIVECDFFDITNYDFLNCRIEKELVCKDYKNNNCRLDILIFLPQIKNKKDLVISIENKIYSGENGNQLEIYFNDINKRYQNTDKLFFYLTPDGDKPSHKEWRSIDYGLVNNALIKTLKNNLLPPNVRTLIEDYQKNIKERILMIPNERIKEICQQIYFQHKSAIDLINKHIVDFYRATAEVVRDVLCEQKANENAPIAIIYERNDRQNSYIYFSTEKISNIYPEILPLYFAIGSDNFGLCVSNSIPTKIKGEYFRPNKAEFAELNNLILTGQIQQFNEKIRFEIEKYFVKDGAIETFENLIIK